MQWMMLKDSTYTFYSTGINVVCVASEQFPQRTVEVDPIILPSDSGYSEP